MPLRIARSRKAESDARAAELLARVGLADRLTHRPNMLSGASSSGSRWRDAGDAAIAPAGRRPTGYLDEATAETLPTLLRDMHAGTA